MMRFLHRWPGLLAMLLVMMLAVSGAVLSVFPAADRLAAVPVESLCRIFDAWRMRGQALQYDMDAAFAWLSRAKVRP